MQLITAEGQVFSGALAVFRSLAQVPGRSWLLAGYQRVPGFGAAAEAAYRLIERHRGAAEKLTFLLWGRRPEPSTYSTARWLFLRALGLIFLAAFLSLRFQVDGLIGQDGILPAGTFLEEVHRQLSATGWRLVPSLCWLASGDAALHALCAGGTLASILLLFDVAPAAALAGLWALYLSLATVSQVFLQYQWDNLLLETAFLTIFLPSLRWRRAAGREPPPSGFALFLLRWLLFRLTFSSGVVKLASGDPSWRDLSALARHYETQPLPTWIGWYAHHLPFWFQRCSALAMFGVELVAPFLLFAPRRLRHAAAGVIAVFQLLILATGNYAFFNVLTIALCLLAVDDQCLARLFSPLAGRVPSQPPAGTAWPKPVLAAVTLVLFSLSLIPMAALLRPRRWPPPVLAVDELMEPFRTVNGYGLFAVMTTRRPEIVIEGSRDGRTWLPYEFRWKPGDPFRRPGFVAPHQPRLDWQMWFAALGSARENPWFFELLRRLLEGSRPVLRLMGRNPFPGSPPRYLRATVYDYRCTDLTTLRRTGAWWHREVLGPYCPVVTLDEGEAAAALPSPEAARKDLRVKRYPPS